MQPINIPIKAIILAWYKNIFWMAKSLHPKAFKTPIIFILSNTKINKQVIKLITATTHMIINKTALFKS